MSASVLINKDLVKWSKEIVGFKRPFWEKAFPNIKFDENGRADVGSLPSYDERIFLSKIRTNTSPLFKECLAEACKELRLKPIDLDSIEYFQYLSKRIVVETETGFTQERSLPSILSRAHRIWEERMPLYRPLRNIYKPLAKERENERDIRITKAILSDMENGNTYIAYDNLMRVYQEKPIILSINPLDKLFSSGRENTNSLTKFSSCWRNRMEIKKSGNIEFSVDGEYSNPLAQIKLGAHALCGMIIIPNGNEASVDGTKFFGMLQRSHVWLHEDAIFLENIYPDKENSDRRNTIKAVLNRTIKTIEPRRRVNLKLPEEFCPKTWMQEYSDACSKGHTPYLDRSCIDNEGIVSIAY